MPKGRQMLPEAVKVAVYGRTTCALCHGAKLKGFVTCTECFEKHVVQGRSWSWTDDVVARLALQAFAPEEEDIDGA